MQEDTRSEMEMLLKFARGESHRVTPSLAGQTRPTMSNAAGAIGRSRRRVQRNSHDITLKTIDRLQQYTPCVAPR
jgi:hypothetical protein